MKCPVCDNRVTKKLVKKWVSLKYRPKKKFHYSLPVTYCDTCKCETADDHASMLEAYRKMDQYLIKEAVKEAKKHKWGDYSISRILGFPVQNPSKLQLIVANFILANPKIMLDAIGSPYIRFGGKNGGIKKQSRQPQGR